jgi:hypothetical protein
MVQASPVLTPLKLENHPAHARPYYRLLKAANQVLWHSCWQPTTIHATFLSITKQACCYTLDAPNNCIPHYPYCMSVNALIPPSHRAPVVWKLLSLSPCLPSLLCASSPLAYNTLPKQSNKFLRTALHDCLIHKLSLSPSSPYNLRWCSTVSYSFCLTLKNTCLLPSFLQLVCL